MKTQTRLRPAGFTLTEMLIVIFIIVILAAIAFPVVTGIREKARSASCAQNLRQIGVGLAAYITENNGRFPDGSADVSWMPGITTSRCWYDAAAENLGRAYVPYHKGDPLPDTFGCPSGHGKAYEPAWPYTGDYAANMRLGRPGDGALRLSAVKHPESTPYVQDTVKQNNFGEWIYGPGYSKELGPAFSDRHGGKGNILWVDGRVTSFSYAQYMSHANKSRHNGRRNFITGNW